MPLIWVNREAEYFCKRGWTAPRARRVLICPSGKISRPSFLFAPCPTTRMARVTQLSRFVGMVERATKREAERA